MFPIAIKVVRFIVTETGTYNDQFRRPYESHLTQQSFNEILENATRASSITPSLFSGYTSQIVAPSAYAESQIVIPEGWGERRFRFMLELEVQYKTGGNIREILTGYSDTPANSASMYGTLAPDTIFRINNTIHVATQVQYTPFGNQVSTQLADCSHLLINDNWGGVYSNNRDFMLRPTDIFSKSLTAGLETQLQNETSFDGSNVLMNIAQKSKRTNAVPTNYVSSIVKNYTNAYSQVGISSDSIGDDDALSTAQQYARENSAARDPFLDTVASMKAMPVSNLFTLNDLRNIDPDLDNKMIYVKKGLAQMNDVHMAGQTQGWNGSDLHTHIANLLANAVPSLMMSHLIVSMSFISTNMDLTGAINTRIANIDGFSKNVDMSNYARAFVSKFENEVLSDIIKNFQVSIGVEMRVDLLSETWIGLTLNNERIDFVVPSFSDALFVPVLTNNAQRSNQLAADMKGLLDNIVDYNGGAKYPSSGNTEVQLTTHGLF